MWTQILHDKANLLGDAFSSKWQWARNPSTPLLEAAGVGATAPCPTLCGSALVLHLRPPTRTLHTENTGVGCGSVVCSSGATEASGVHGLLLWTLCWQRARALTLEAPRRSKPCHRWHTRMQVWGIFKMLNRRFRYHGTHLGLTDTERVFNICENRLPCPRSSTEKPREYYSEWQGPYHRSTQTRRWCSTVSPQHQEWPVPGHLVAQLVKRPTLGFGSGHDFTVCEFEPHVRAISTDCLDSLSLPFPGSHALKINFQKKKKRTTDAFTCAWGVFRNSSISSIKWFEIDRQNW